MKNDMRVLIISGGTCKKELVGKLILEKEIDTVIVVDGGLKIADELELIPDYIVGDFDTIDPIILDKYRWLSESKGEKVPVIREFKPEKDDTDTEIAIRLCVELKPQAVYIVGGTGSRLDHTFANIHLLKKLLDVNIPAFIYDNNNKVYLIQEKITIIKNNLYGPYFSMLPFTQEVHKITLRGFKYPLTQKDICFGTSLCISNEVVDETATVDFEDGILIVFESKD